MRTLIVNFKNYPEVRGDGSLKLAAAIQKVSASPGLEVIAAPPTPMLALVASKTKVVVYSQSVGAETGDKTTGAILPEAVKGAGGSGTILNHSESRIPIAGLKRLVPRVMSLGMGVCLCAETTGEAVKLSELGSKYLAIEPPELVGSGVAVSKAKPELVRSTVTALRRAGYRGRILCGAGITSGKDVAKAVELGAEGVLVASSVVKAPDWVAKMRELSRSLT
jgi:triosephosphate isomerase